jgi:thioredoxin 1
MPSRPRFITVAATTLALLVGASWAWRHFSPDEAPAQASAAAVSEEEAYRAVIYPDGAQAKADIAAAFAKAAREKKRVLLDFGGNWCGDCHVLEIYFHDPANRDLLEANYVLVPVNIGRYDVNLDIAARYGVPVAKGVPALAVLEPTGKVVYSQRNGEFEAMRTLDSASVTTFLVKWKS